MISLLDDSGSPLQPITEGNSGRLCNQCDTELQFISKTRDIVYYTDIYEWQHLRCDCCKMDMILGMRV